MSVYSVPQVCQNLEVAQLSLNYCKAIAQLSSFQKTLLLPLEVIFNLKVTANVCEDKY